MRTEASALPWRTCVAACLLGDFSFCFEADEEGCFQDRYLVHRCCAPENGEQGAAACWRQLYGEHDAEAWQKLFERCCLRLGLKRDLGAVLVPDVLAGALVPGPAGLPLADDLALRLVATGLTLRADGTFALPPGRSVLLNVGTHTFLEDAWVRALARPETTVLCFEPDRTAFHHLRLWSRTNLPAKVGHEALERLFVLPIALGPVEEGVEAALTTLHRSDFADGQCNSLLPPNPRHQSAIGAAGCGAASGPAETVLVVPLREILRRLAGRTVELLKIDAQGLDLEVVRSGGTLASRMVERLQLEVQDVPPESRQLLYDGSHTQQAAVEALAELGFALENCSSFELGAPEIREHDCLFANRQLTAGGPRGG